MAVDREQVAVGEFAEPFVTDLEAMLQRLRRLLGEDGVDTSLDARRLVSSDVYGRGETCAAVIRPADADTLARAVRLLTQSGCHVIARGAGLTYTGAYLPISPNSVVVDVSRLNRILDVSPEDMTITVEAGVTWQQIHEAVQPLGLRLPFFGTFSGARATVGGGLSNGALFFGTARHGMAADCVLGLDVILADGTRLATGQTAFRNATRSFYRCYGPDLTGLFLHDSGALGIKVQATFRLMETPAANGFASFAFTDVADAARALSAVARAGVAEDAYVFDPVTTESNLAATSLRQGLATLMAVARAESGWLRGSLAALRMALVGRRVVPRGAWSLHLACAGRSRAAVQADLARCRQIARQCNGREVADSVPRAVRAAPFPNLNGVLGPEGDRWAALNCKVAHSEALAMIEAVNAVLESWRERMAEHGITTTQLLIAISSHAFSVEPVLRWRDEWLPIHRAAAEPEHLAALQEPEAAPEARALVDEIRSELVAMFAARGAASNQIGKTYPYLASLQPPTATLVAGLKSLVDPDGMMNPGALGLGG